MLRLRIVASLSSFFLLRSACHDRFLKAFLPQNMLWSQSRVDGHCLAMIPLRQVISGREIIQMGGNRDTLVDADLGFPESIDDPLWSEALSGHLSPLLSLLD